MLYNLIKIKLYKNNFIEKIKQVENKKKIEYYQRLKNLWIRNKNRKEGETTWQQRKKQQRKL